MSIDERSPAERVPIEIIPNILQHLSTSDMKNARLVNSKWYQASRSLVIQKRQRFVLDGLLHNAHLGLVLNEIESYGYHYYDFEFHNEDFNSSRNEFLAFIDSNLLYIRRLSFINCSSVTVEEIMLKCINLEELVFKNCSCDNFQQSNAGRKMIQENLLSLEIQDCDWITDDVFGMFCDIYPNMQRIRIRTYGVKFVANFRNGIRGRKPLFLKNSVRNCFRDEFFDLLMSCPWIQLEELSIQDPHYNYREDDFEAFLLTQRNLKSFNLKWVENFHEDSFELLFDRLPGLKRLNYSLRFAWGEESIKRVIETIAKSELQILQLEPYLYCHQNIHFTKYLRNHHTYYLNLSNIWRGSTLSNNTLVTSMLKIFHNLTYLNVSKIALQGPRKELVMLIFREQNQLRYLKVNDCNWISDFAFKKCYLPRLEYLEMKNTRIKHAAFSKFDFPKLKFLRLEGCHSITDKSFASLPSKCPLLRYLNVKGTVISEGTILNICGRLKFLHCIDIKKRKRPPILDVDTISQLCPSLRFIQMGRFYRRGSMGVGDLYTYDQFEKKWNKYDNTNHQCFRCEPSKRRLKDLRF